MGGGNNKQINFTRIVTQRITGVDEKLRLVATIVGTGKYFADSTNSINILNGKYKLEFILALLNSKLYQWRFKKTSSNNNVSTTEIESMPFKYDEKIENKILEIVNVLLSKKPNQIESPNKLMSEIDTMVYELYGLSEEEIKVVESN